MSKIARAEIYKNGKTGDKFKHFAQQISYDHKDEVIDKFINETHTILYW